MSGLVGALDHRIAAAAADDLRQSNEWWDPEFKNQQQMGSQHHRRNAVNVRTTCECSQCCECLQYQC